MLKQFNKFKTEIRGSPTKQHAFKGSRGHPTKMAKLPIMAHKVEKRGQFKDPCLCINFLN